MQQVEYGLSPEMERAIAYARLHGGIVRYPGGFWARREWPGCVETYVATTTIEALVRRGVAAYTERHAKGFPITMTLTDELGS